MCSRLVLGISVVAILVSDVTAGCKKNLQADCSLRSDRDDRRCRSDCDCKFKDEVCYKGRCVRENSLYTGKKCPDVDQGSTCTKRLAPYCGPKTKDIRFCKLTDCECKYSDEYCDDDGLCKVAQDLYKYFTCPEVTFPTEPSEPTPTEPSPTEPACTKVLEPDCRIRTMEIRYCSSACDCLFNDEFCNDQGYCQVQTSLYDNYQCPPLVESTPEPEDPCATIRCKNGWICEQGQCIRDKCALIRCRSGYQCINGQCVPIIQNPPEDPCAAIRCKEGWMCHNGECIDKCAVIRCQAGYYCINGQCIKQTDPCDGVTCAYGEECQGGNCISKCAAILCIEGTQCINGECVPICDPCKGVTCGTGQFCQEGKCVKVCNKLCIRGTHCVNGECVPI